MRWLLLAVWVPTTALLTAPVVAQLNPAGISMLRHFGVTVVTTFPSLELKFAFPGELL